MSSPFPTSETAFHALPDERACTASHAAGPGRYASRPPGLWLASICSALARARVAVCGSVRILESRSVSRGEKSLRMSSPMTIPVPTAQAAFHALPDERACTASHATGTGRHASRPPGPWLASICSALLARARVAVCGSVRILESRSVSRGEKSLRMSSPVISPVPTAQAALHALPDERACTASYAAGPGRYASRPPGLWLASICSALLARARVAVCGSVRILESRLVSRGEKSLHMSSPVISPVPTSQAALHALPDERACTASYAAGPGRYASRPPGLWHASICSALARARVAVYGSVRILESRSVSGGEKSLRMSSPMTSPVPTSQATLHALPDERACTASHAAGPGRYASPPPGLWLASICSALARARVAVYGMYGYVGTVESQSGCSDRLEMGLNRSLSPCTRQPFAPTWWASPFGRDPG